MTFWYYFFISFFVCPFQTKMNHFFPLSKYKRWLRLFERCIYLVLFCLFVTINRLDENSFFIEYIFYFFSQLYSHLMTLFQIVHTKVSGIFIRNLCTYPVLKTHSPKWFNFFGIKRTCSTKNLFCSGCVQAKNWIKYMTKEYIFKYDFKTCVEFKYSLISLMSNDFTVPWNFYRKHNSFYSPKNPMRREYILNSSCRF